MKPGSGNKIITRANKHEPFAVDTDLTRIREELLVIGARLALRARRSIDDFGHPPDHAGTTMLAGMSRKVLEVCEELASIPDLNIDWIKSRSLEDSQALSPDHRDAHVSHEQEAFHTQHE